MKVFLKSGFWVVLSVTLASLLGNLFTRNTQLIRLFYLGISLLVISFIFTLFALRKLSLNRSIRGFRQQLGQVLEERYDLTNQSFMPKLWVQIDDESNLPLANGSRVISNIRRRENRSFSSYTLLSRRGLFNLGPTVLSSGDPFGLFGISRIIRSQQTLLVLPHMVELASFPFPAGYLSGGKVLRRKSHEVTPHAAGIREYAPGDALNRIHWPATARKEKFMVKEFDQDPQADIWIFMDGEEAIHTWNSNNQQAKKVDRLWVLGHKLQVTIPEDTFEYAVCVSASISNYFIKQGEAVGLACNGQLNVTLPVERGERQLGKILEGLAYLEAKAKISISTLVNMDIQHISRGSTVILITTNRTDALSVSVELLLKKNFHPIIILIDNGSFGGEVTNSDDYHRLLTANIPVITLKKGDDIKKCLEITIG